MNKTKIIVSSCLFAFGIVSIPVIVKGNRIVTASWDRTAKLWDLEGNCLVTFQAYKGWFGFANSASFNPAGDRILTASADTAKLWDLNGNCLSTLQGHTNNVSSAAFNPAGNRIVTASYDRTAKIWNLKGNCLVTFRRHTDSLSSAAFNPAGNRIVTASYDGTAKIWNLKGNCLRTFQACKGWFGHANSASFNPAGNRILTASSDKTAKLWDLKGNCLVTFQGHTNTVYSAAFNPLGDRIVTASRDKTAKLWDLEGNCLVTFHGHTGWLGVWSAVFNPTGDRILTASDDKTARLWDLEGNCLITFQGHMNSLSSATFSPIQQPQQTAPQAQLGQPNVPPEDIPLDHVPQPEEDPGEAANHRIRERNFHTSHPPHHHEDEAPSSADFAAEKSTTFYLPHQTSLFLDAVINGDYETVQQCLCGECRHEELFEARDLGGLTALHLAAREGYATIVRLLLKHGMPVNIPVIGGEIPGINVGATALHYAVAGEHYEVITMLLSHQASLQAIDVEGDSPLHLAPRLHTDAIFDIVNALLIQGASTTSRNNRNQTPFDIAVVCNNELIRDVLFDWQSSSPLAAPNKEHQEEEEPACCICLEPLVENAEEKSKIVAGNALDPSKPCGHRIHAECSTNLYRCPLCNKDLNRQVPWMRLF